ncbi:MAG: hypothetical protein NVSMB18_14700 [Acetobacteraceae bacterium]
MLGEDEENRPRIMLATPPLDRMGLDELDAYIAGLRGEIARAEAEIARKRDHRSAADSVFKRP